MRVHTYGHTSTTGTRQKNKWNTSYFTPAVSCKRMLFIFLENTWSLSLDIKRVSVAVVGQLKAGWAGVYSDIVASIVNSSCFSPPFSFFFTLVGKSFLQHFGSCSEVECVRSGRCVWMSGTLSLRSMGLRSRPSGGFAAAAAAFSYSPSRGLGVYFLFFILFCSVHRGNTVRKSAFTQTVFAKFFRRQRGKKEKRSKMCPSVEASDSLFSGAKGAKVKPLKKAADFTGGRAGLCTAALRLNSETDRCDPTPVSGD